MPQFKVVSSLYEQFLAPDYTVLIGFSKGGAFDSLTMIFTMVRWLSFIIGLVNFKLKKDAGHFLPGPLFHQGTARFLSISHISSSLVAPVDLQVMARGSL